MRAILLAATAALVMSAQLVATAKAEDSTTVIRRDAPADSSTTVIKKRDDINLLPIPHTEEKKVIIHKDHDDGDSE